MKKGQGRETRRTTKGRGKNEERNKKKEKREKEKENGKGVRAGQWNYECLRLLAIGVVPVPSAFIRTEESTYKAELMR